MLRTIISLLITIIVFVSLQACQPRHRTRQAPVATDNALLNLEVGKLFLAKNKLRVGVHELPSGLQFTIKREGMGNRPVLNDYVTLYYQGQFINGAVFDGAHSNKDPITVQLKNTIPAWQQAIQLMQPGAIWVSYVPPNLAYGEAGIPGKIAPNQTLVYYIHLLSFRSP